MAQDAPGGPRRTRRFREAPLSRERVLAAALRLADEEGIEALSMRRLGQALDVEAMSLYRHVGGKEDILDGIADLVMAEVEVPAADLPWREAVRRAVISTHDALLRHPWAGPVLESRRTPGPTRLTYLETVVGHLRRAGFPVDDVARAFMALDAHVYGFTMQEVSFPFEFRDSPGAAEMQQHVFGTAYPNLAAMAEMALGAGPGAPIELEFGLDMLLDGLERRLAERLAAGEAGGGTR